MAKRYIELGPYDRLYAAAGLLWPDKAGRMVTLAADMRPPGHALDVGCGDGKNLVYLERRGWVVDGIDISPLAISATQQRAASSGHNLRGEIRCGTACTSSFRLHHYELAIAYGLYHCLTDSEVEFVHCNLARSLKPGGLFAFAAFNDDLPVPSDHGTGQIYLRPKQHILTLVAGWEIVAIQYGEISESHLPLVQEHRHSLTWGLFRVPEEE